MGPLQDDAPNVTANSISHFVSNPFPRTQVRSTGCAENVIPLRRTIPCASGVTFGISVEIHHGTSPGRAALALHELHELAEQFIAGGSDPMLAMAEGADALVDRLGLESNDDISVSIGVALSPVGRSTFRTAERAPESAMIVRRGALRVAVGTSSDVIGGPVATVSRPTASASLCSARSALQGNDAAGYGALVVESDGELSTVGPSGVTAL